MSDKRVIFMGTPDFACPILETLIKNTNVIMVVTQPDKEVGRKKELKYSPIKELALKNNIPVFQPTKIRLENEEIISLKPDMIVTCAYGQIIPKNLLDLPKYGAINVHASILPKYRGGAPIHHAIINGEEETGITIMYMDEGMDTGDIISVAKIPILAEDNVGTLHDKLSLLGAELLEKTLPEIFNGTNNREKQDDSKMTLAYTIKREDELINFNDSGKNIINKIRGLNPFPSSYFLLNGNEIKVYRAEFQQAKVKIHSKIYDITKNDFGITCNDGIIFLKEIKPMGKTKMNIKDYLNGINKEELKREGSINNE